MSKHSTSAASILFVGLAAVVAGANVAQAQSGQTTASPPPETMDRGRDQDVRGRSQSEYDPIGIPMGSFRLYPRLGASAEWNDNVFAEEDTNSPVEDWAFTLSGGARLASQWGRHELVLEGLVEDTTYAEIDQKVDPVWRLGAEGRLDIVRGFEAAGEVFYRVEYEPRGENDAIFVDEDDVNGNLDETEIIATLNDPIKFDAAGAFARLSREFNRLRLTGRVDFEERDYDDGTLTFLPPFTVADDPDACDVGTNFDQDFRDRNVVEGMGRADYAISPDTALFVAASHRQNDYDHDTIADNPCVGADRDFNRTRVIGGVALDLTNLIRGEFGVGYAAADFDNPGIDADDVFTFSGSIDWFITQLTTLNLAANRDVLDSGDSVAPARIVTDVALRVDHELLRNLILWARGGWAEWEYEGPIVDRTTPPSDGSTDDPEDTPYDRTDTAQTASFGADWLVNRWAAVQARFVHLERDSEGLEDFRDFDQNRVTIGVTLRR
jgi:hypothetical protein